MNHLYTKPQTLPATFIPIRGNACIPVPSASISTHVHVSSGDCRLKCKARIVRNTCIVKCVIYVRYIRSWHQLRQVVLVAPIDLAIPLNYTISYSYSLYIMFLLINQKQNKWGYIYQTILFLYLLNLNKQTTMKT